MLPNEITFRPLLLLQSVVMIRIRHITDPELKRRVIARLAEFRGMSPGSIPEWFELDDADYVDILNALKEEDEGRDPDADDPRM